MSEDGGGADVTGADEGAAQPVTMSAAVTGSMRDFIQRFSCESGETPTRPEAGVNRTGQWS
ncbi:MAG: hypothetical protein H0U67_15890 [Gemmatimonadetes bacterium]|nr:hypothetical protein [Gemmatimonadota bacterium]